MATPLKNWFRVADSILREDLTQRGRSTFLGLLAWFNQRRARDGVWGRRACEASIPPGDLLTVTLENDLATARECLSELAPRLELTIEPRGAFTFVRWPNVASFQKYEPPKRGRVTGKSRVRETRDKPPPIRSDPFRSDPSSSLRSEQEKEPAAPPLGVDLLGEPVKPKHRDFRAEARAAWPAAVAAAARHGKRWETLNASRLSSATERMREHPDVPDLLVRLVDGAVAYWRKAKPKDADLTAHLVPETVFRAGHAEKYLEHYSAGGVNGSAFSALTLAEAKRRVDEKRRRDDEMFNEVPS